MRQASCIVSIVALLVTSPASRHESFAQVWERTNGPMGSDVTAIGFHSSGWMFAGTDLRGVFRSFDDGQSWEYAGVAGQKLRGFAEDIDGSIVAATFTAGVLRSDDLGQTWTPYNVGLTDLRVHSIAKSVGGVILVGTLGAGAFVLDREAGWIAHNEGLLDLDVRAVAFDETGGAYAATFREGVFHWPGGRLPWTHYNGGSSLAVIRSIAAHNGLILAGAWSGGMAYTRAGDTSWTSINDGLPNQRIWKVAIGPNGTLVAGMIANGIYRFDSEAQSWKSIGLPENIVSALEFEADGTFWAGTRTGIYRADNMGEPLVLKGVPKSLVYATLQTSSGAWLAATEQDGIFRSTDEGNNWIPTDVQVTDVFALEQIGDFIFAGGTFGYIYRSDDDGLTWSILSRGPDDEKVADPVTDVVAAFDGWIFASSFGSGILRSNNDGESWKHAGLVDHEVSALATGAGGRLFAATFDGVFVSDDSSATWSPLATGLPNSLVRSIWIDANDDLFVGTVGDGLFRLPAGTDMWEAYGLDGRIVFSILRGTDGALYAGTYGSGVFRQHGSVEWEPIFQGLSNPLVISLGLTRSEPPTQDQYLLAGTDADGVFKLRITATSNATEAKPVPAAKIYPVFPNPFSEAATFSFELPQSANVRLRVFDLLGRVVGVPVSGTLSSGRHRVEWVPEGAANGIYLFRLEAGSFEGSGLLARVR